MDRLTALIHQKIQYFDKAANVVTENIANAELKGAKRKDLVSFESIWRQSDYAKDGLNRKIKDIKNLTFKAGHFVNTHEEISRELSSLQLTRISHEQNNLVLLLKKFANLQQSILST